MKESISTQEAQDIIRSYFLIIKILADSHPEVWEILKKQRPDIDVEKVKTGHFDQLFI